MRKKIEVQPELKVDRTLYIGSDTVCRSCGIEIRPHNRFSSIHVMECYSARSMGKTFPAPVYDNEPKKVTKFKPTPKMVESKKATATKRKKVSRV